MQILLLREPEGLDVCMRRIAVTRRLLYRAIHGMLRNELNTWHFKYTHLQAISDRCLPN